MKYEANWSNGEVQIPLSYAVEGGGKFDIITDFEPEALKDQLCGQALLAHKNFQNLLKQVLVRFPTNVTVTRLINEA